jgi:hypothetical protein
MGAWAVVVHVELLMDHLVVAIMCAMNGKGGSLPLDAEVWSH